LDVVKVVSRMSAAYNVSFASSSSEFDRDHNEAYLDQGHNVYAFDFKAIEK